VQLPPCNNQQLDHIGHQYQLLGQHSAHIHLVLVAIILNNAQYPQQKNYQKSLGNVYLY
jgi:hypothetical protein